MQYDFIPVPVPETHAKEHRYYCPECKGDKLYLNVDTRLFHCKHCGFSGKHYDSKWSRYKGHYTVIEETPLFSKEYDASITKRMQEHSSNKHAEAEEAQFRMAKRMKDTEFLYPAFRKYPYWVDGLSVCTPGYLLNDKRDGFEWTGYQSWMYGRTPKYIYRGIRGLWVPKENIFERRIIVCEGRFEALLLASRPETEGWIVVCTFGNRITDKQLETLLFVQPKEFALAYDNDKLSAFTLAYNTLCPYAPVTSLRPPSLTTFHKTKDWDDFFVEGLDKRYPDELLLFSEKLKRS